MYIIMLDLYNKSRMMGDYQVSRCMGMRGLGGIKKRRSQNPFAYSIGNVRNSKEIHCKN